MPKCPKCNESLVEILYGEPTYEASLLAEQKKIYLGGCIVGLNNPKYHCYKCDTNLYSDLKETMDNDFDKSNDEKPI